MRRFGILCSSSDQANSKSKTLARGLIERLVHEKEYEYVMGAGSTGMMRMCQKIILENGASLEIVGIEKTKDLENSLATNKMQVVDTFERTRKVYQNSDILLFLSGGFGTMAELYGMMDASIEMEIKKPILIYNEDHSYDLFFADLKEKVRNGFASDPIFESFCIVSSQEELFDALEKIEERSL